ncbi:MAG: flagellin N-terminal helical domain-containing protein [Alphaproteobacteria bacterium]
MVNMNLMTSMGKSILSGLRRDNDLIGILNRRISTGRRFTSVLDGGSSFLKSNSFYSRANDIFSYKSGIDSGLSSIKVSLEGIKSARSILEQIKSLAEQSTEADRAVLELQAHNLVNEYDSILSDAKFGGMNLLEGTGSQVSQNVSAPAPVVSGSATGIDDHSDSRDGATGVAVSGGTVSGAIGADESADYFAFTAVTGVTYNISTNGGMDSEIWLEDSIGTVLAHDDNGGGGNVDSVSWTASSDGVYYLRIQGVADAPTTTTATSSINGTFGPGSAWGGGDLGYDSTWTATSTATNTWNETQVVARNSATGTGTGGGTVTDVSLYRNIASISFYNPLTSTDVTLYDYWDHTDVTLHNNTTSTMVTLYRSNTYTYQNPYTITNTTMSTSTYTNTYTYTNPHIHSHTFTQSGVTTSTSVSTTYTTSTYTTTSQTYFTVSTYSTSYSTTTNTTTSSTGMTFNNGGFSWGDYSASWDNYDASTSQSSDSTILHFTSGKIGGTGSSHFNWSDYSTSWDTYSSTGMTNDTITTRLHFNSSSSFRWSDYSGSWDKDITTTTAGYSSMMTTFSGPSNSFNWSDYSSSWSSYNINSSYTYTMHVLFGAASSFNWSNYSSSFSSYATQTSIGTGTGSGTGWTSTISATYGINSSYTGQYASYDDVSIDVITHTTTDTTTYVHVANYNVNTNMVQGTYELAIEATSTGATGTDTVIVAPEFNIKLSEDGEFALTGHNLKSDALGIDVDNVSFDSGQVAGTIERIDAALEQLKIADMELVSDSSFLQTRLNFNNMLESNLTEAADKISLADLNEEAASLKAVETRQMLAMQMLSFFFDSQRNILKLFDFMK